MSRGLDFALCAVPVAVLCFVLCPHTTHSGRSVCLPACWQSFLHSEMWSFGSGARANLGFAVLGSGSCCRKVLSLHWHGALFAAAAPKTTQWTRPDFPPCLIFSPSCSFACWAVGTIWPVLAAALLLATSMSPHAGTAAHIYLAIDASANYPSPVHFLCNPVPVLRSRIAWKGTPFYALWWDATHILQNSKGWRSPAPGWLSARPTRKVALRHIFSVAASHALEKLILADFCVLLCRLHFLLASQCGHDKDDGLETMIALSRHLARLRITASVAFGLGASFF
ncbi:hypothetical protein DL89DRAFT_268663 [Linderina pennispora]|uniref:Secreted protein n=1 Tax=Linderina pennispora TaxID=61395 RepID=A0A1Y1W4F9_9FUNG|nr:uncharacterized protein DL89DRAFT_268663 [Linderina pennispora]ORX68126.1 hypothetical protein DL89DRAFT_268663 [Linderina pennispora]